MKDSQTIDNTTKKILNDQSGQTFIEYILLLASIVAVAYSFMRVSNEGIGKRWTEMAKVVLDDDSQTLTLR